MADVISNLKCVDIDKRYDEKDEKVIS